jgi:hypothetical protein
MPDWLRELEAEIADHAAVAEPSGVVQEVEVEEPETAVAQEVQPEEELPDWLRELEPGAEQRAEIEMAEAKVEVEEPEAAFAEEVQLEEELPGWLQELQAEAEQPAELEAAEPLAEEEIPDWLREPEAEVEEAEAAVAEEVQPEEELPGWLRELEAEAEQPAATETVEAKVVIEEPEAVVVEEAQPEEETPDWLSELQAEREQPAEAEAAEPVAEAELPERLQEPEAEVEEAKAPIAEQELPDWLLEMRAEVEGQGEPEEEGLGWLAEVEAEDVSRLTVDEMPAWLDQLRAAEGQQDVGTVEPEEGIEELLEVPQAGLELAPLEPSLPEEQEPEIDVAALEGQGIPQVPRPDDPETHLSLARACLRQGDPDASAGEYELLVRDPALTDTLIPELEEATQTYPGHHALQRVLGDAYMRAGQLQKALDAYKAALSTL